MAKKSTKLGVAIAAGAGATALVVNKTKKSGKSSDSGKKQTKKYTTIDSDYRNTELGKNEKNSKGIY